MLIETFTGHETFSGYGSINVTAFHRQSLSDGREQFIGMAAKDTRANIHNAGSSQFVSASPGNKNHGAWVTARMNIADGGVIKVFIKKSISGMFPSARMLLLRARETAGLKRIRIPFTQSPLASLPAGYFEGKFDIITPELFEPLDVNLGALGKIDLFELDKDGDFYTIDPIEKDSVPITANTMKKIVTATGQTVKVAQSGVRRRITLRGRIE